VVSVEFKQSKRHCQSMVPAENLSALPSASTGLLISYSSTASMTETPQRPELPDHLSIEAHSPHHVAAIFEHDIGIRFNDKERTDVTEYCISEGWIKVPVGNKMDRKGHPLTIKLKGRVEAFYK
jgi:Protein of unknown function (DUF3297)